MAIPTKMARFYNDLLVTVKSDAVADRICDDGERTPTIHLNLGLGSDECCAVVNRRSHIGI